MHRSRMLPYWFIMPAVLIIVGVIIYPMAYGIYLSVTDRVLYPFTAHFVGLQNFQKLIQDERFLQAVRNSVFWSLYTVVGSVLSGLIVALILNQKFFGRQFARGVLLVPWTVPTITVAIIWVWLYDPMLGIFNQILRLLGASPLLFLSNMRFTLFWVSMSATWRFYPFVMLMLLAGLQSIDQQFYDAAALDGANALQKFWHITLPSLRHILGLVTVLEFIWLFNHFDIIWIMTGGGPADATHILATYGYYQGFKRFQYAYASAIGVVMLIILSFSAMIYLHLQERTEVKL